jgi:hypothetical protein
MENKESSKNRIDLLKWFINTVVIGLLTFFFTWVLNERKQGVEEIKVYNTYIELVTKVDGLAERRLLAEFFSNVTVSSKLKEGWEDYYIILDKQYKNEIARQDSLINKIDSTTIIGKVELENAILVKNKIKNTGLTSPIISERKIDNYQLALEKELEGFNFLLEKNIDDAISAFSSSENAYNSFHQVYEIAVFLKNKNKSQIRRGNEFWKSIYQELLVKYSWKMPEAIKLEFQKRTNN